MTEVALVCAETSSNGVRLGVALGSAGEAVSVGVIGGIVGACVAEATSVLDAPGVRRCLFPAKLHPARASAIKSSKLKLFLMFIHSIQLKNQPAIDKSY